MSVATGGRAGGHGSLQRLAGAGGECGLRDDEGNKVIPDLWFAPWRQAIEYDGSHHQEDRDQYNADIDRYLIYRRMKAPYLQVTKERMRRPRLVMRQIYRALVDAGYEGPEAEFGELWATFSDRSATSYGAAPPEER